ILLEYDVVLVQEVRDADLSAVNDLMGQLKSAGDRPYDFLISVPLGRGTYKEQYLFIYRPDMVSVLGSYYYDDGCESCGTDTFSREPFIVKFSSPTTREQEALHPKGTGTQCSALQDMIFLGDFNADCSYVPSSQWPSIRLRSLSACEWLIPDSADTTVADTDCAYDRIVACGTALRQDIEPGSATVNNFQKKFQLQMKDALAVSDHFPVEVTLKAL
ncbi:DNAS1 protein, partial [Calcarius ornatus]|nr:DNAS1 protein [Calcarius ornatus]